MTDNGRNVNVGAEVESEPIAEIEEISEEPGFSTETGEAEVVEISEEDVGSVDEILEAPEPSVDDIDWSPQEDKGIIEYCLKVARALLKIKGVSFYRNPGKTPYVLFNLGNRRCVSTIFLSKKSVTLLCPGQDAEGKTTYTRHKITADGIFLDDKKVALKDYIRKVRQHISYKKWA